MLNDTSAMGNQKVAYIVVESVITVSAVLGNTLVIWAVKHNPGLRNITSYFIVSLALADMAVALIVIPLAVVVSLGLYTNFYTCLFMCCILVSFTSTSILSLLAIAIDRYLRIKIPTRYRRVTTLKNICLSLVTCWLVSFIVGLVPMLGWNRKAMLSEQLNNNSCLIRCKFTTVIRMDYMIYFNFFGWVLLPLLLMSALYLEIFYLIRKQLKQNITNSRISDKFYGREYKTAKSLALVLILYALCWLPISILNCVSYFWPSMAQLKTFQLALHFSILLSHAHSAMNPVVYAFRIKKFKETYKDIVYKYILQRFREPINAIDENTMDQISQS